MSVPSWLKALPSIPYPPAREDGYWAPVTSTIDWCEENYYATHYSAEIVNSLTNLTFVLLAAKGIYNCLKYGHRRVFLVAYLGYLATGLGSFAFHSTLTYPMQLVDELSMIYTTSIMVWATFQHGRPQPFGIFLAIFMVALSLFITLYYHYLEDPLFHQNAFAILTFTVLFRSMYLMEMNLRPYFRKQRNARHTDQKPSLAEKQEQERADAKDMKLLKEMWILILTGLGVFMAGFVIWNMDTGFCSNIRSWRREVGLPWGILLEGHGWWHLLTGYGSYVSIVWGTFLRHIVDGRADQFYLHWPHWWVIPTIKASSTLQNGHTNGSANGSVKGSAKKEL